MKLRWLNIISDCLVLFRLTGLDGLWAGAGGIAARL